MAAIERRYHDQLAALETETRWYQAHTAHRFAAAALAQRPVLTMLENFEEGLAAATAPLRSTDARRGPAGVFAAIAMRRGIDPGAAMALSGELGARIRLRGRPLAREARIEAHLCLALLLGERSSAAAQAAATERLVELWQRAKHRGELALLVPLAVSGEAVEQAAARVEKVRGLLRDHHYHHEGALAEVLAVAEGPDEAVDRFLSLAHRLAKHGERPRAARRLTIACLSFAPGAVDLGARFLALSDRLRSQRPRPSPFAAEAVAATLLMGESGGRALDLADVFLMHAYRVVRDAETAA